jgi:hypothetical protein
MNIISVYLNQILLAVFLAVSAWLAVQAKNLYRRYINTETKQKVVQSVVRFVEQVYIDLHGRDKLEIAMHRASQLLAEYGIDISEQELVTLIEAAVNEFNNTFNKNVTEPPAEPEQ